MHGFQILSYLDLIREFRSHFCNPMQIRNLKKCGEAKIMSNQDSAKRDGINKTTMYSTGKCLYYQTQQIH